MQSQHWIIIFFITSLAIFSMWDVYLFISGKTTLSRYVINKSKKSKTWAYSSFLFVFFILIISVWLFFHWEINCIIFNFACWIDI